MSRLLKKQPRGHRLRGKTGLGDTLLGGCQQQSTHTQGVIKGMGERVAGLAVDKVACATRCCILYPLLATCSTF